MEKLEWLGYLMVKKISKISLFVLAQLTNVTDRQTDRHTGRHRMPAIAALMHSIAWQKRTKNEPRSMISPVRSGPGIVKAVHVRSVKVGRIEKVGFELGVKE